MGNPGAAVGPSEAVPGGKVSFSSDITVQKEVSCRLAVLNTTPASSGQTRMGNLQWVVLHTSHKTNRIPGVQNADFDC